MKGCGLDLLCWLVGWLVRLVFNHPFAHRPPPWPLLQVLVLHRLCLHGRRYKEVPSTAEKWGRLGMKGLGVVIIGLCELWGVYFSKIGPAKSCFFLLRLLGKSRNPSKRFSDVCVEVLRSTNHTVFAYSGVEKMD